MSEEEGVRVNDKRRIDPETFEVRQPSSDLAGEALTEMEAEAHIDADAEIIEGEVSGIEEKIGELTEDLQRVHAEYANYRKRVDRDREINRQVAIGTVFSELLPVLDDLELAREHDELNGAFKTVGEKLENSLHKLGLTKFGMAQDPFDPNMHEALVSEEVDGVIEPTVIAVFQQGYRQGERILRPARVSVAGT